MNIAVDTPSVPETVYLKDYTPPAFAVNSIDLDIRVFKDGVEYKPWRLNKDFMNLYPEKGDNVVDNVEKVEIDIPQTVF